MPERQKRQIKMIQAILLQYIQTGVIPKGSKNKVQTIFGNQNQEFLDKFYNKLKDFLLILMKDIVKYCDKTTKET